MASSTAATAVDLHAAFNRKRIFILSVIALTTAGINSALRTAIAGDLQTTFFDPIDRVTSAQKIGSILGVAFLGFAFTIAIGSPLLDYIGMGRLLFLSSLCFTGGTLVEIFAGTLSGGGDPYWVMFGGMIAIGVGWGLVETVINPLTVTLYPDEKTKRLNALHAWWPAGLIIGGLASLGLGYFGLNW